MTTGVTATCGLTAASPRAPHSRTALAHRSQLTLESPDDLRVAATPLEPRPRPDHARAVHAGPAPPAGLRRALHQPFAAAGCGRPPAGPAPPHPAAVLPARP